ncbi:glycosyltransferase family 2 protein [Cryobacterium serini]|uniref:Glycosyltransferase family 2 protein n=1 Tax=Cryobacterium serini TaxID=1259201 RepID=A0A4R9BKJ3_9MICO|nr:glycosyltransferase family 2 protein [Cryobacterium serini]TFD86284.1 glycosyltransferase family 2 protein [Cryobacterium serini]
MSETLSVALCTYNGAAHVAQQLGTILEQTLAPDEIIVSDDGSSDDTVQIIETTFAAWQEAHPGARIALRVVRNATPLGVTANFEQALKLCIGDLLALSDQDDLWHSGRLARMTAEFSSRPTLQLLHTDARLVDATGKPLGTTLLKTLGVSPADQQAVHIGRAIHLLLRRNIVTGATMMLRRELLQVARPFPAAWVHDEWLAVVAAATGVVDLINEPLIDYRQHGSQQIGASSLDTAGKLARLRAPGGERNASLLARSLVLNERAPHLRPSVAAPILAAIAGKVAHEQMRSALPVQRVRRIGPIVRESRRGRYASYGLGLQDVLRDLVQPL